LLLVSPVHLVSLPRVPPPSTGRFGPEAIGTMFISELRLSPPRWFNKPANGFEDSPERL